MKVLISLLSTVLASATASRVAMETDVSLGSAPTIPTSIAGWTRAGPATGTVKLVFAVKLQNTLELEERLLRISDPKHAEYGQQLTRDEANALVAPTQESVAAVTDFLGEVRRERSLLLHHTPRLTALSSRPPLPFPVRGARRRAVHDHRDRRLCHLPRRPRPRRGEDPELHLPLLHTRRGWVEPDRPRRLGDGVLPPRVSRGAR